MTTSSITTTTSSSSSLSPKVGFLFGHHITHSLSPIVHTLVFAHYALPYTYRLHDSPTTASFLSLAASPAFYGAAVTMPHKVDIIPLLDALTPEARAIGAVNTVFPTLDPRSGARLLVGTNTDCVGIREALRSNLGDAAFAECRGRPALVVGGGGTSRAAVYALARWVVGDGDAGGGSDGEISSSGNDSNNSNSHIHSTAPIYMLNRDADEVLAVIRECRARGYGANLVHITSVAQARSIRTPPAVIVSAIPDFPAETPGEVMVRECLSVILGPGTGTSASASARTETTQKSTTATTASETNTGTGTRTETGTGTGTGTSTCTGKETSKGTLLEMCYHPSSDTAITRLAERRGWAVIPGTEAMVWQGLEQDRYWTGRDDVAQVPGLVEAVKSAVGEALLERARAESGSGSGSQQQQQAHI